MIILLSQISACSTKYPHAPPNIRTLHQISTCSTTKYLHTLPKIHTDSKLTQSAKPSIGIGHQFKINYKYPLELYRYMNKYPEQRWPKLSANADIKSANIQISAYVMIAKNVWIGSPPIYFPRCTQLAVLKDIVIFFYSLEASVKRYSKKNSHKSLRQALLVFL